MAEDEFKSVVDAAREHQQELGLPGDFLERLANEDDWSFVIKVHALLEAALTNALTQSIGNAALHPVFQNLEMSRDKCGKVSFALALGLIEKDHARVIRTVSRVRNHFVHNVQNVTITLQQYIEGLDRQQKVEFAKGIAVNHANQIEHILSHPKRVIWYHTIGLIALVHSHFKLRQAERMCAISESELVAKVRSSLEGSDNFNDDQLFLLVHLLRKQVSMD